MNKLFENISKQETYNMLNCLSGIVKKYKKNEIIFIEGDEVYSICVVLKGLVQIIQEDFAGNRNIIAKASENEVFAEAFVCSGMKKSPVTVFAEKESEILFIPFDKIIKTCPASCPYHTRLIENLMRIMAIKSMNLNIKMQILFNRTIREKLIAYLSMESKRTGDKEFFIPFDRNELADYLAVNRSAMSRELGKMREEGILGFNKNKFILY